MTVDLYFKRHEELIVIRFTYYLQFISECLRVRVHIHLYGGGARGGCCNNICLQKLICSPPPPNYQFASLIRLKYETRCVCGIQMTPIMANFKDGQDHEDKYFGKKISSQEMTTCNMEALVSFKEVMTNVFFFGQMSRSKGYIPTK